MNYNDLNNLLNSYRLALTTMSYDAMTIAPKNGSDYRNKAMSLLSGEYFKLLTSNESFKIIESAQKDENPFISASAEYQIEELKKIRNIPQNEYVKMTELKHTAQEKWEKALKESDFDIFSPYLKDLIESTKNMISYRDTDIKNDYEKLLDDYEKGLNIRKLDDFFDLIKDEIVPFIDVVIEAQGDKPKFLSAYVSKKQQKEISKLIMKHLGYTSDFGYLGETTHPFSSTFSINDSRITTSYDEYDFTSNIFSIIHEVGHSMYNHQVNPEFEGLAIANNMSFSMHESQSRFLENNIGRSKEFWIPIYSDLQAIIPEVLGNIELDEFIRGINYVEKGYIRTEADELTYSLHILVRYEMEKAFFLENLSIEDANEKFNELMESYLGIKPKNDQEGILQDIHWASGSFGYFPTYALGSAYAAQIHHYMKEDINLYTKLLNGEINMIFSWLQEHVHQHGGRYQADTILRMSSNESFNPKYYVDYLKEKYSHLLGI